MHNFEFFKTSMPNTRKADFYLGCLDGSVFIDYNKTKNDQISLVRISFDGYGCCNLNEKAKFLNKEESALLIEELNKKDLDQKLMTALVKKSIKINEKHLWKDALEKYELIERKEKNT